MKQVYQTIKNFRKYILRQIVDKIWFIWFLGEILRKIYCIQSSTLKTMSGINL